jgi:outer membrane protein TolC
MNNTGRISLCILTAGAILAGIGGCASWYAKNADNEVYGIIDQRQEEAIGIRSDAFAGEPTDPPRVGSEGYSFVPHALDPEVPPAFTDSVEPTTTAPADSQPTSDSADSEAEDEDDVLEMGFRDVIAYASRHNRNFQRQKESLYLSALALSLERFLWTPQLLSEFRADYANFGQITDFDQTLDVVAEVAAEQRLPFGGRVTAQMLSFFMRNLRDNVTTGESSQIILSADIPLLRGAGKVAYESRYQAERDLIYSVRLFERQRRELFVSTASEYFRLVAQQQAIRNAEFSVASFEDDSERAKALNAAGRTDILDVQRAEAQLLNNLSNVVEQEAAYQNNLDTFKIQLGMPVEQAMVLYDDEVEIPATFVSEEEAIETALRSRLTLLTDLDLVSDVKRRARNAANFLLPDLNVDGSVTFDTDPDQTNLYYFQDERVTWRAGATLSLPVNRRRERNDYRAALIEVRRAERDYELAQDLVRQEVRAAVRVYLQAEERLLIQEANIENAVNRREAAAIKFELGRFGNRDKVEAEDELRNARDNYANAVAQYKAAILAFWLNTGTLRIDENGNWVELVP